MHSFYNVNTCIALKKIFCTEQVRVSQAKINNFDKYYRIVLVFVSLEFIKLTAEALIFFSK